MNRINLFLLLFVFNPLFLMAQTRFVDGIVTTFDSIPLMKASIEVKSSKQITLTDSLGSFRISCENEDKIVVTARGFAKQNVKITPEIKYVMVNLKLKPGEYNQELAIGYGHVKKSDKLFAISTLKSEDIDYSKYPTLERAIAGRFPGVIVQNNEVIVRGNETFGAGNGALIVIDGVAKGYSIAGIPPYTIKSISILKDASAAAYGSQGANGVVLIETKRGVDE